MGETFREQRIEPQRVVWPESANGEAQPLPRGVLRLTTSEDGWPGSTIVLDFGRELFGGVRCEITHSRTPPATFRVRLGESVTEAVRGCLDDHTLDVQAGQPLELGPTGFRFLRLDLLGDSASVEVRDLHAFCRLRDLDRIGTFRCSDPLLETVWRVGADTVHLCMQDLLWDGVKRGRTVWAGDLYPAIAVIGVVFGECSVVSESLDHIRDASIFPGEPRPSWMNGIPAYSLWWILALDEWYLHTGRLDYLERQRDYLSGLLRTIFEHVDPDGREQLGGWRFLDWATVHDSSAVDVGYRGLLAWALRRSASLGDTLGEPSWADRCRAVVGSIEKAPVPTTDNKQALALSVLGGLDEASDLRMSLASNPTAGLSPFLGYSVLEARALAGDHSGCLELIRTYWGKMIELGATTFWEDFDLAWAENADGIDVLVPENRLDIHADFGRCVHSGLSSSLCHAWSAGPTAWLSRHVLGVRPLEPGFRAVVVQPRLAELEWAEGTLSTPLGPLGVRHRKRADGTTESEIDAPAGVGVVRK